MLTGRLVRGARAMLGWSVETLAHRAHVGTATVVRIERIDKVMSGRYHTIEKIERAFHDGGIRFVEGSDGHCGIEFTDAEAGSNRQ